MSPFLMVNDENFEEQVTQSEIPVLVEFGAEWCAPCKRLEPILEQLHEGWAGKVVIAKVDVDESPDLAMNLQVMSVPTMILFVKGQPVERLVGLKSREKIADKISQRL